MAVHLMVQEIKHPDEQGPIDINVSAWLGNATITNVDFTAKDQNGQDATSAVLDAVKSTFTGPNVRPWYKGGADKMRYQIFCKVTDSTGAVAIFIVEFEAGTP